MKVKRKSEKVVECANTLSTHCNEVNTATYFIKGNLISVIHSLLL